MNLSDANAILGTLFTGVAAAYTVVDHYGRKRPQPQPHRGETSVRSVERNHWPILLLAVVGIALLGTSWYQKVSTARTWEPSLQLSDEPSALIIGNMLVAPRQNDIPFHARLWFQPNREIADFGWWGMIVGHPGDVSQYDLDAMFRRIHAVLMSHGPQELSSVGANDTNFVDVYPSNPTVITDEVVKGVTTPGSGLQLYVMVSWRYRLPGSSEIFIKDFCAYYGETFQFQKACGGTHNSTFVVR
jgi:hypothetical protein